MAKTWEHRAIRPLLKLQKTNQKKPLLSCPEEVGAGLSADTCFVPSRGACWVLRQRAVGCRWVPRVARWGEAACLAPPCPPGEGTQACEHGGERPSWAQRGHYGMDTKSARR